MELFKFGMYVFFPIVVMVHYGDPEWYRKYVLPDRPEFLRLDKAAPSPPRNPSELQQELDHFKQLREERRMKKKNQSTSFTGQGENTAQRAPAPAESRLV